MFKRTSVVQDIRVITMLNSSILEVGDSAELNLRSRVLAVQREAEVFYGREGNFNEYPVFSRSLPIPQIEENVTVTRYNLSPFIRVKHVAITAISSSSVLHIGSTAAIDAECRIKNIRQLLNDGKRS
ncbi:spore germination protein GerPE [Bacillus badius]|uniref:spore germination protein GerPE n=1 Tax=Bacillus badius TaxID=1455 RepID=UPI002E24053B|nr:spore germination protein GerPE [Bacillus badius]